MYGSGMRLENVDFNLLLPLRALLEERSVSKAAEKLQRSQPALSAALSRLRTHFNDELLERRGNRYELTPLAVQLLERSYSATVGMERIFLAQAEFDPSTSSREFTIVSSDYGMSALGSSILHVLADEAPNVRLRFHNISGAIVANAPDSLRDYDGLFMPHGYLMNQNYDDLFDDRWVCIVDSGNTAVGDALSLNDLSTLHWVFTYSGLAEFSAGAKQMQMLGIEPKIDAVSPGFLVVPSLLEGSDRIALVQQSLARRLARGGGLRVLECPFDVVPLREAFWWNSVHARDPEHVWFRHVLSRAVRHAGLSLGPTTA
ncbi:MAG: LysR family transcriptional regulator [Subtercola sp.]|nr:LysR family transcriptional regulator [Subtercola sp.]